VQAFLADEQPDSFERVVDRLLATPAYGERWARHWMDIWRYSDWYGLDAQLRHSQKHIWHWRDWIIESLNGDKPYDVMIREMLAGDEIAPADPAVLRATGFLARNYFLFNRNTWLEETVEHTGKAFLGLTLNCAKCHAHKFDPIAQEDFYRFRAFFEPHQVRLDPVPGQPDLEKDGLPRVFDAHPDTPTFLFARGDERMPDKARALSPGVPEVFDPPPAIVPAQLPLIAFAPATNESVQRDQLALAEQQIDAAIAPLGKAHDALVKEIAQHAVRAVTGRAPLPPPSTAVHTAALATTVAAEKALAAARLRLPMLTASFAADRARLSDPPAADAPDLARAAALAENAHALATAEASLASAHAEVERQRAAGATDKITAAEAKVKEASAALEKAQKVTPGDTYTSVRVARKAFEGPTEKESDLPAVFPSSTTGRRLALAKWITARENPLTARVAVNHIWLRHFGEPLVPDVVDFGRRSPAPPQQKLLDWLAVEFMESGWSMKHLHRLIVTSAAYRMRSTSAGAPPANMAADPENRLLWRRTPQRMEGELIRDAALFLAGELDRTLGGPTVSAEDSKRRALYFIRSLNDEPRFLTIFDAPSVLECYRRLESTVPAQALAMANSKLTLGLAPKIAARIGALPDADFVTAGYETLLGAPPSAEEGAEALRGLAEFRALHAAAGPPAVAEKARTQLIHVLLNHNDFVTVR